MTAITTTAHPPLPAPAAGARHRILEAAEAQFLQRGFRALTMDELAAELGMSKKTLYQHFPGKRELLDAVIDARLARIEHDLTAITGSGSGDVAARLQSALAYVSSRLGEIQTVFLQDVRRDAPEVFAKVDRFRRQAIPRQFGRLLEEGRRQGLLRGDLPDDLILEILLAPIQTLITPEVMLRRNWSPRQMFETILTVTLEGLLTPAGRRRVRRDGSGGRRAARALRGLSIPPGPAEIISP